MLVFVFVCFVRVVLLCGIFCLVVGLFVCLVVASFLSFFFLPFFFFFGGGGGGVAFLFCFVIDTSGQSISI